MIEKASELTDLASTWLAATYPESIIVRELSVADWGGARIDIAAITAQEIVGVEVKGAGDSPSRLELQGFVYGRVARRMWVLPCEQLRERCFDQRPRGWGRLEVFDGAVRPMNTARKLGPEVKTQNGSKRNCVRDDSRYEPDEAGAIPLLCPFSMCGTLWRDELYEVARRNNVQTTGKALVHALTEAIVNQMPAPMIHAEMIRELRSRVWRKEVLDTRTGQSPGPRGQGALL
ncbi:hypothetical protein [Maritimibacter sp. DP1N21-5]|uniref:hypothetical protein n=1 Tax=Maritimibacter sp. DP1N21-5 TaxID=2836867 RepID=UPI001C4623E2|nr:hypothetical protein [Maritimibacter sp. DP1N21-5]MBV7408723.1 hypothetical protein [Maritimibacter sp. DP1N21-5]